MEIYLCVSQIWDVYPPGPSISKNCHSCLHGKPNFSAKLFKIDEMLAPTSINPVTSHPSILTLASLTLPISRYSGSGLYYFPSPLFRTHTVTQFCLGVSGPFSFCGGGTALVKPFQSMPPCKGHSLYVWPQPPHL